MGFIQNEFLDRGIPLKTCTRCKERKPIDQFATYTKRDRENPRECLRPWCKACFREDYTEYRRKEPSARKQTISRSYLKNKAKIDACNRKCMLIRDYGMSMDDYDRIHSKQEGKCAICRQPEVRKRRSGELMQLSVDHDHETGATRELLCHKCNAGIGFFGDDLSLLREAIKYIERHKPMQGSEPDSNQDD